MKIISIKSVGKVPNTKISQYLVTIEDNGRLRKIMMTVKDLKRKRIPETYMLNPEVKTWVI